MVIWLFLRLRAKATDNQWLGSMKFPFGPVYFQGLGKFWRNSAQKNDISAFLFYKIKASPHRMFLTSQRGFLKVTWEALPSHKLHISKELGCSSGTLLKWLELPLTFWSVLGGSWLGTWYPAEYYLHRLGLSKLTPQATRQFGPLESTYFWSGKDLAVCGSLGHFLIHESWLDVSSLGWQMWSETKLWAPACRSKL